MNPLSMSEDDNPRSKNIDALSTLEIVQLMNDEDSLVAAAVHRELPQVARAIDAIASRMKAGGRLFYVGAGTSGRLGALDASECPPTFGTPPEWVVGIIAGGPEALRRSIEGAEDKIQGALPDLMRHGLDQNDVVAGISASGRTPFVLGAIEHARALRALTLGISCNQDSPVSKTVDIAITPIVGPEVITGSTRLKAGTATKMVLNMLTTATMIRLGRVAGNLMIDLDPACSKLEDRAVRIVTRLSGLDPAAARDILQRCDGDARIAVLCATRGLTPEQARMLRAES